MDIQVNGKKYRRGVRYLVPLDIPTAEAATAGYLSRQPSTWMSCSKTLMEQTLVSNTVHFRHLIFSLLSRALGTYSSMCCVLHTSIFLWCSFTLPWFVQGGGMLYTLHAS